MHDAGRRGSPVAATTDLGTPLDDRDLAMRFESLGGNGHGCEFGLFQRHYGAEPLGLLRWADLADELLVQALQTGFDGIGAAENTILFTPDGSDEWWTKDQRYWMAMRSFVKVADTDRDTMMAQVLGRLTFLRRKLIEDLQAGEKVFVYRDMFRNLPDEKVAQLHAAVRAYGPSTLFYIRYADSERPAGTVEAPEPGLLIGYVDRFTFSPDDEYIGPVNEPLLALCRKAHALAGSWVRAGAVAQAPSLRPRPPRPRRIVVFGNCQMQAMSQLYVKHVSCRTGDTVRHVASYEDLTAENRAAIESADLIVEQLFDLKQQADADGLGANVPRLFMPMVTAGFLWPFAGQPHPKNADYPFLNGGPYGGEASDSYLNRLILAGTPAEQAVETYGNLDVGQRVNLDRLFELVMDRQKARDEATGYAIAGVIERYFRTEPVFLSPYHPNTRIAVALATQFFERLGASRDDIDRMRHRTRITPFPKTELPLHPAVCKHFGLGFVSPDRRYRFMNEGSFTFREYALRYMRYEWNDALEEGMSLTHAGHHARAIERLRTGLERSPMSADGHGALGHVLSRVGEKDGALAAMRRAAEIEPDNASFHANLGNALRERGDLANAEAELRKASQADPTEPHFLVLLSHVLRQTGRPQEAAAVLATAVELDPWSVGPALELAGAQEAAGDWAAAVATLRSAIAFHPGNAALASRLAHALHQMDKDDDALEAAQAAVNADPASAERRTALSAQLLRQGRPRDALTQAYIAAVGDPGDGFAYAHLAHVLRATGDAEAAELAYLRAIALQPGNAHFRHEISGLLSELGRHADAAAAARAAAEQDGGNAARLAHLAHVLARGQDLRAAQAAQRRAVEMAPDVASHRIVLSDLYAQEGRLAEALAEAQAALAQAPGSAHALGHLAHIKQMMGDLDDAIEQLRAAITLEPDNQGLRRQRAALEDRRASAAA